MASAVRKGAHAGTYISWQAMKQRCKGQKGEKHNAIYSDRGITYDPSWESYDNFLADMGERPDGTTLDRKDNDKGYCKANCRWATPREQANNTRSNHLLEFNGEIRTVAEWAAITGISQFVIHARLRNRWTIEKALTKPTRRYSARKSVATTIRSTPFNQSLSSGLMA